jgi:SAM-dependent methyltransferase
MNNSQDINTLAPDEIRAQVRQRYGRIALDATAADNGCCTPSERCCGGEISTDAASLGYSAAEASSAPAGANLGLGCGNPLAIASLQPGQTVLDLGAGAGFDCFLAVRAVGPTGRVIGVDMTHEMLAKARANAAKSGHGNVEFRLGEIEALPVADASVDVILSNCVINLSPDKPRVFREALRVLRSGGRLAVSDIVATAPLPAGVRADWGAYTGCMAGASLIGDLEAMLRDAGFSEIRIEPKDGSGSFIREWLPGSRVEDYLVSASISAVKP